MKIITINNTEIKEINISGNEENYTLSVVYSLVGDDIKLPPKRIQLSSKDLTTSEKKYLSKVVDTINSKIKQLEKI